VRASSGLLPRLDAVGLDLATAAVVFGTIFLVELPDKTFIATLVMSTKMRPLFVWIGVALAFLVQTGVAVGLGKAASFLPEQLIHTVAALMFVIGAIILFREARSADENEAGQEDEYAAKADANAHGFRVVVTSFLVLFAAEWGDLSQLFTITLVAKYEDPIGVFIGALGALMTVSALAVVAGRQLLRWIPLHVLHYVGAGVCLTLALVTGYELVA